MPPSPPTRVGSSRTCWPLGDGRPVPSAGVGRSAGALRRRSDDELDLDAVADDPGQRLADQRAVAGLQPVLGEAVRDGDPEALLIDVDELRCRAATSRSSPARATPGARRGRLARPASRPFVRSDPAMWMIGRWVALARMRMSARVARVSGCSRCWRRSRDGPEDPGRVFGGSRERLRRRGPGEDSTGRTGAARQFCDTPGEYRSMAAQLIAGRRAASRGARPAALAARPAGGLTPFSGRGLSSAGRRRAVRFRAPGAFACLQG